MGRPTPDRLDRHQPRRRPSAPIWLPSPHASVNYWSPSHDTCVAECRAALHVDDDTRRFVWDLFLNGPPPVGYDPRIVPAWTGPTADAFAVIRLEPWRLRVFPGTVLLGQGGRVLTWREAE
jgi:hypothetical protein